MKKLLLPLFVIVVVSLMGNASTRAITAATNASPIVGSQLGNISTRCFVQTGDNVMIGGFIVQGTQPKRVIIRAIGPELGAPPYNVPGALADPTLELHDGTGALIASNDNWQHTIIGGIITGGQVSVIQSSGHAPSDPRESAIIADLPAGNYTAIVRGVNNTAGVALVEVYDLSLDATSILYNISTRAFVQTADNVMIGGFIVKGTQPKRVIVRAIGPELGAPPYNIPNALVNPTLELHNAAGALIGSNDNWRSSIIGGIITADQVRDIRDSGLAPGDGRESAIIAELPPGNYTAIVRGVNDTTGVGLVEVYDSDVAMATLNVRTFLPSDAAPNGIGGPGPSGVVIYIDGVQAAITGSDGTATFQVPAGTLEVAAELRPSNAGQASVTLAAGEARQVDVILDEGKEISEDSTLIIDQLVDGVLDRNFNSLTLRFKKSDGSTVSLKSLDFVTLEDAQGGNYMLVTQFFALQPNGILALNDVNSFRNLLLSRSGKILMNVHGDDTNGGVNSDTAEFFVSLYTILGNLAAPPSNPSVCTEEQTIIEAATHHLGDGPGNEGIVFQKSFTAPGGVTDARLKFDITGPNYESAPQVFINGHSAGSIQRFFPPVDENSPMWQTNGDGSHDYLGTLHISLPVTSLLVDGQNTFRIQNGRADDDYWFWNVLLRYCGGVQISEVIPDSTVPNYKGVAQSVLNFHSIPRPGNTNFFDRFFTLKISKPAMSTVKKVTVTLLGPDPLMTVVDEAPGNGSVEEIDEKTLRVRVAIKAPRPSTVNSQPPPAHQLKYRFKLVVTVNGVDVSDEKDSGERRGLWRMPDGFARTDGLRDPGGDDWCSRGTYAWLAANRNLITKIDDISGEHGRNIGHIWHKHGTDIDMFHFYRFPGAVSGGDNYSKLVNDVKLAITAGSAGAAAKQRVRAWVNATHSGLDALAAKAEVTQLIYANGWGFDPKDHPNEVGLSSGWAERLLKTGMTSVSGTMLDLGTGIWRNTNNRYLAADDHNDHVHITLSRPNLGE